MAVNFYFKKDNVEIDIESYFGLRVFHVEGMEPSQPKELYTRDWAAEDGVKYYLPPLEEGGIGGRRLKASDLLIEIWIEDDPSTNLSPKTATEKYRDLCSYLLNGDIQYRDTLRGVYADVLYNGNKLSWMQHITPSKLQAQIMMFNPSGKVTLVTP